MEFIIWAFVLALFLGIPLFLTIVNVIRLFEPKPAALNKSLFDVLTIVLGAGLSILDLGFLGLGIEYTEPLILGGGNAEYHSPLSGAFELSYFIPEFIALLCMILLSVVKRRKPPLFAALLIAGVYMGNVLHILLVIQLLENMDNVFAYMMIVFPVNYLLMSVRLIRREIKEQTVYLRETAGTRQGFIGRLYAFLERSVGWYIISFAALIPLLAVLLMILILCGQGADGIVKAFTETADWTFSKQIPPPPEYYHGHYLCTVAAGGHEKIVKPQRMGIRRSEKIVVNRQLCIANAFEELIQEKLPHFHKGVRHFYDSYGYPLSKLITTKTRADIVYILMKPLELIFITVLYMFDTDPENRIALQYTGKKTTDFNLMKG